MMSSLLKKIVVSTIFLQVMFFALGLPTVGHASEEIKLGIQNVKLSDEELNQVRGGYGGVNFGIRFSGNVENVGPIEGVVVSDGANSLLPTPGGEIAQLDLDNGATIQAYVGNFDGASGIFQIVQSPGSNNVINNNLMLEITIINVMDGNAIPSLETFLH